MRRRWGLATSGSQQAAASQTEGEGSPPRSQFEVYHGRDPGKAALLERARMAAEDAQADASAGRAGPAAPPPPRALSPPPARRSALGFRQRKAGVSSARSPLAPTRADRIRNRASMKRRETRLGALAPEPKRRRRRASAGAATLASAAAAKAPGASQRRILSWVGSSAASPSAATAAAAAAGAAAAAAPSPPPLSGPSPRRATSGAGGWMSDLKRSLSQSPVPRARSPAPAPVPVPAPAPVNVRPSPRPPSRNSSGACLVQRLDRALARARTAPSVSARVISTSESFGVLEAVLEPLDGGARGSLLCRPQQEVDLPPGALVSLGGGLAVTRAGGERTLFDVREIGPAAPSGYL